LSSKKVGEFHRRFFIVSNIGLHFWADRDAMEDSKPLGHFVGVRRVLDRDLPLVPYCETTNCLFAIECEEEDILFVASSAKKKHVWMSAIREHALQSH